MNPGSAQVIEFENVRLEPTIASGLAMEQVGFSLAPGELALIKATRGSQGIPLAAAACGLQRPASGSVRFLGTDWLSMTPRRAQTLRHSIGRVFGETEWISNLNVDENILLGTCHHTRRPEEDILAEALALAQRLGLDELTGQRPHLVGNRSLRAYALVRAFLDTPRFVILERPLRGVMKDLAEPLIALVKEVCAGGCAVLWLTSEEAIFDSDSLLPAHRFVFEPPHLRALEETRS